MTDNRTPLRTDCKEGHSKLPIKHWLAVRRVYSGSAIPAAILANRLEYVPCG